MRRRGPPVVTMLRRSPAVPTTRWPSMLTTRTRWPSIPISRKGGRRPRRSHRSGSAGYAVHPAGYRSVHRAVAGRNRGERRHRLPGQLELFRARQRRIPEPGQHKDHLGQRLHPVLASDLPRVQLAVAVQRQRPQPLLFHPARAVRGHQGQAPAQPELDAGHLRAVRRHGPDLHGRDRVRRPAAGGAAVRRGRQWRPQPPPHRGVRGVEVTRVGG